MPSQESPIRSSSRSSRSDEAARRHIPLSDAAISRKHCVIEIARDRTVLRDLGSTNGTYVSGQRIDFAYLEDRTEFDLGSKTNTLHRNIEVVLRETPTQETLLLNVK